MVGAGVIGLAVARALALAGIEVLVLEQASTARGNGVADQFVGECGGAS
ncbi:MAG: NAD(P)-binding protein [Stellaceae bacterium]